MEAAEERAMKLAIKIKSFIVNLLLLFSNHAVMSVPLQILEASGLHKSNCWLFISFFHSHGAESILSTYAPDFFVGKVFVI